MRKWLIPIISLLLTLALTANGAASPLAPFQPRPVTVTVVSTEGQPLSGSSVQVLTPGSGGFRIMRTNDRGQVTLDLPDGFSFWLRAWAEGYSVAEQPYVPSADGPVLTLKATAYYSTLTGLVVDELGRPVANAKVSLWLADRGLQGSGLTNAEGRYTVEGVQAQAGYALQIEAMGFQPFTQSDLNLDPGARVQLDVQLTRAYGTVTGEVIDSRTSDPVAGATAELVLAGWGVIARKTTDGYGYFHFDAPPWGESTYQVRLNRADYETYTSAAFTVDATTWVDLTGTDRIDFNPLYAELTGSVLSDTGEALAKIPVELQRSGLGTVATGATDDSGFFLFDRLPAGTYRVRAIPEGDREHGASPWVTLSGGDRATSDVSANNPDKTSFGSSAIVGTVRDQRDNPVAGAAVTAVRGTETYTATTDSQGRYRLAVPANIEDGVDPETSSGYHVSVTKSGFISTDQPDTADNAPAPAFVDVRYKATNRADFTLQPATAELAGRVLDDRGRPAGGLTVVLVQEGSGEIARTVTAGTGVYRFSSLPVAKQARYQPMVITEGYFDSSMAPGGALVDPVMPAAGSTTTLTLTRRPSVATIQGLVKAGADKPAAGATVTVVRPADGKTFTGTAGDDGYYSVKVEAGPGYQYLVRVARDGDNRGTASGAIDLGSNHAAIANASVAPLATIAGKVYQPNGRPAAKAEVTVWAEGDARPTLWTLTDEDGHYQVTGLKPGRRYTVMLEADMFLWSTLAPGEAIITPLLTPAPGETLWADLAAPLPLGGN